MKKHLLICIVFFFGTAMIVTAQIPNPGFENWTSGNPDNWLTSNVPAIGLVNVFQSEDNHSGSYAVRGDVVTFLTTLVAPVIQSGQVGTGFPISEKYQSLELYYKFTSVGGDRFSVNVALMKSGNPIAQGAVALPATLEIYTCLSVPITYTTTDIPDAAVIQISIVGPNTGTDFHLGSTMFVDDLMFSLETGTGNNAKTELTGKCFPNPAVDVIHITLNDHNAGEVSLKVFNAFGKEVKNMEGYFPGNGEDGFQLSVSDLVPGIYLYSISGPDRQYNGKFSKVR